METRSLKNITDPISLLGFGAMRLPTLPGDVIDIEQVKEMVTLAMQNGVNYFDTAYVYHNQQSEGALKKALVDRFPRDSFYLADKMPVWMVQAENDLEKYFDEQLKRLGVEYIDFYLLHALDRYRIRDMEKFGGFDFLERIKKEGRAKYIGFSFHDSADILDDILRAHHDVDFVQLQLNYLDWDSVHASEYHAAARKYDIPIVVMEPVKGGSLANLPPEAEKIIKDIRPGESAASWAIRFAASQEGVLTVLSGMSDLAQVTDNLSTLKKLEPLTGKEREYLDQVLVELGKVSVVPCTSCKYCVNECPQHIDIPGLFTIYNEYKRSGNAFHAGMMYRTIPTGSRADQCTGCESCIAHCPQKIDIPAKLQDVAGSIK